MREERTYFVYMLASRPYGTLYIGVTNDLYRRMVEHREGRGGTFTKKYKVAKLIWFEPHGYIDDAIQRETSLKRYPRAWKINLIERSNPDWHDLFPAFQKYEPKMSLLRASSRMGPGHAPSATANGLAQDDTSEVGAGEAS